jgi:hypothetical protein
LFRSMLTFTASALNGVPSWKFRSLRNLNSIYDPSAANDYDVASSCCGSATRLPCASAADAKKPVIEGRQEPGEAGDEVLRRIQAVRSRAGADDAERRVPVGLRFGSRWRSRAGRTPPYPYD